MPSRPPPLTDPFDAPRASRRPSFRTTCVRGDRTATELIVRRGRSVAGRATSRAPVTPGARQTMTYVRSCNRNASGPDTRTTFARAKWNRPPPRRANDRRSLDELKKRQQATRANIIGEMTKCLPIRSRKRLFNLSACTNESARCIVSRILRERQHRCCFTSGDEGEEQSTSRVVVCAVFHT